MILVQGDLFYALMTVQFTDGLTILAHDVHLITFQQRLPDCSSVDVPDISFQNIITSDPNCSLTVLNARVSIIVTPRLDRFRNVISDHNEKVLFQISSCTSVSYYKIIKLRNA